MRLFHGIAAAAVALGTAGAAQAVTYTLTFDRDVACGSLVCLDGTDIDQAYGDTALVDISYQRVTNPGDSTGIGSLAYWSADYGDLVGVAWGGVDDISGASQIIFTAAPGYTITLIGLDIAGWPNVDRPTISKLYDSSFTEIATTGAFDAPGTGHWPLTCFGTFCTRPELVLEWGPDGFNVGVDNVTFEVTRTGEVPEPAAWTLMIGGFGLVGSALRRRRIVAA